MVHICRNNHRLDIVTRFNILPKKVRIALPGQHSWNYYCRSKGGFLYHLSNALYIGVVEKSHPKNKCKMKWLAIIDFVKSDKLSFTHSQSAFQMGVYVINTVLIIGYNDERELEFIRNSIIKVLSKIEFLYCINFKKKYFYKTNGAEVV